MSEAAPPVADQPSDTCAQVRLQCAMCGEEIKLPLDGKTIVPECPCSKEQPTETYFGQVFKKGEVLRGVRLIKDEWAVVGICLPGSDKWTHSALRRKE